MTEKEIQKKKNQLRSLASLRGLSEDELRKKAITSLEEKAKKEAYQFQGLGFPDKNEFNKAKKLFENFRDKHNIENIQDLQILEERLYLQYLCDTYKISQANQIKKYANKDTVSFADIVDARQEKWYKETLDQINHLDDRLGLNRSNTKEGFDAYKEFYERAIYEAENNIADHIIKCAYCGEWNHLIYAVKDYKSFPYAMLRGTWLYNEKLMALIDEGKLTMEDVKDIWHQPTIDYVKMCYEEIYLKDKELKSRQTDPTEE